MGGGNDVDGCSLITLDNVGYPQARLMHPFEPEEDLAVWLATNRRTRKVQRIQENPYILLSYHDPEGGGYVALSERARLEEDPDARKNRWKEDWRPFYPAGPTGDDYILIAVVPFRIELMSFSKEVASDPLAWRPAILSRQQNKWILDEP